MSRGAGAAQRFVLDRLAQEQARKPWERWVDAPTIARDRAGQTPTAAQAESVRRAIRTLAREGTIETKAGLWSGRLLARLPLTATERKADHAHEKREQERQREREAASFGFASYVEMVAADEAENRG